MNNKLLLVDDDTILLQILNDFFEANGFRVTIANNGLSALSCYQKNAPDVILMDLEMPGMSGFEVLERIREEDVLTPIILMTGSWMNEGYKIKGYELGAIQFLEKPVSTSVLLAQIKSLLHPVITEHKVKAEGRLFCLKGQILTVEQQQVKLKEREAQILAILMDSKGNTISRKKIQIQIWGTDDPRNNNTLDNLIYQLKRRLEQFPELSIQNAYSRGYRLNTVKTI
jgi:DNA-binding response OmpR family regulator